MAKGPSVTWGQAHQGAKVSSHIAFTFSDFSGGGSTFNPLDYFASLQGPGGARCRPLVVV